MIDLSVPLAGMNSAASTVDAAAAKIAAGPSTRSQPDSTVTDVVSLSAATIQFSFSAKAERIEADMERMVLDMVG